MADVCKHYETVKSIKRQTGLPDTYFVSKYSFSPYKACQHACKYCDGRSEKYYVSGDFEKDIVIRENIAEVLDEALSKFREKGIIGISSGVSDPYQPVEHKEKLMEKCAKVILKHGYPAMLFTKSNMVLRDIDIWEAVHKKAGFTLFMSIVHSEDSTRKIFEPYASSLEARLNTLRAFKARGIDVGVLAMPLLPFITDGPSQLEKMVKCYHDIGVDVIMPGGLTLRPGVNKNVYLEIIKTHFPDLLGKYEKLYGQNRQSGAPSHQHGRDDHLFGKMINHYNMPTEIPHKLYKGRMPVYDEIYILLTHMVVLYDRRGVSVDRLVIAKRQYKAWLEAKKTYYNRRRNLSFLELESMVINMLDNGQMMELFSNEKLLNFFKEVIINRKTFNYTSLKLEM